MAKTSFLEYLDKQLDKIFPEDDYQIQIDWDKKNFSIEVSTTLAAEYNAAEEIIDEENTTADDVEVIEAEDVEVVEVEDGVLFYSEGKTTLPEDTDEYYMATIPFDNKKGVQKGVIDAFISYFKDVLDEGQSDLLDFATKPEVIDFELKWEAKDFAALVEEKLAIPGNDEFLAYPKY